MAGPDDLDNARVEGLKEDVPRTVDPAAITRVSRPAGESDYLIRLRLARVESEELLVEISKEELRKLRQQHGQRRTFFLWAVTTISAVLAASAAFMIVYFAVRGPNVESAVMIAWLSSGLVETLGLGYIIANYLFAGAGKSSATKADNGA